MRCDQGNEGAYLVLKIPVHVCTRPYNALIVRKLLLGESK